MSSSDPTHERFLSLLRPLEGDLEIYARRMVWRAEDVPDTLQNAAMRAYAAFDRYREDSSFRAWIFRIVTNECFTSNRKHAGRSRREIPMEAEERDALASLVDEEAYVDWLARIDRLDDSLAEETLAALARLTENERAVLLQRAVGGLRYQEVAESLGIPLGSVMGHLARARRKMRDALRPETRSQRRSLP